MVQTTQSFIPSMDVWLAVFFGVGLLLLGAGIGGVVFYFFKKNSQVRMEEEAEERVVRRLAEEERSQRIILLEEKDNWYKDEAQDTPYLG